MARPKDHTKHVTSAVSDLLASVTRLLGTVGEAVRSSVGGKRGGKASRQGRLAGSRGPGKGNSNLKSALKASWARYTPRERAARIKKMLAARGLKPKVKKPPTARGLALQKAIKASWAKMTPEQRAERIAKMQKGRGLKPKAVTT